MLAKKMILETDKNGCLIHPPPLPPNASMEVIFLMQEPKKQVSVTKKRKPSSKIFGKGRITGDIISPVVPPEDWEALQ